ncbi:MAG TPA: hypothetical protein VNN77_06310 [candidate division Zixibacteria bacterium]|nr:hypothetical protein [candidate division Zixibacteria bacterium]
MATSPAFTYSMSLEVYLQGAVVRGLLVTSRDRLSNELILRAGDEVFSLTEATIESLDCTPLLAGVADYLIYMQEVFCIADLSPQATGLRPGSEHLYVKKEANRVVVNAGPYWLRGNVHLAPGAPFQELFLSRGRFVPVTDAVMFKPICRKPRTYLVNRTKISCLTAAGDVV